MNYNRPRLRSRLTAVFTLVLTAGLLALPATAGASDDKVDICKATSSATNPYSQADMQTVNKSSIASLGHDGGAPPRTYFLEISGHGLEENNVIPPFTVYASQSQINNGADPYYEYEGLNWTAEGEAFWLAGCTFTPVPDFDLTGNTGEVCLGDEVTITGENTGNVTLHITGTLTLPNETEMPLKYTLAPGEKLTVIDTPVQLGVHEISLDYAYDDEHVGNEKISFTVVDCDTVVTQCPSGFTQISAPGANPVLCTQTVTQIQVQERIVEVPVPELPTELPTGPTGPDEPADEADETSGPILPTELATGFGPTDTSNTIAWYALALMGLAVTGAGVALRRN
jgi:hypothetical protein